MTRIHKSIEFLLKQESPSDFVPDLVYRPRPGIDWHPEALLVDYELSRLREFKSHQVKCAELEDIDGHFQGILLYVTQFDSLSQVGRDLYAASKVLSPSGQLRVLVRPKGRPKKVDGILRGIFASIKRASGGGDSLLICEKPVAKEFVSEDCELTYLDPLTSISLRFNTRSGMFSCTRIDPGTEFLLAFLPELRGARVLDVGCGYGIIGLAAAARGASVTMIDADARAVKLTRRNLALNHLVATAILDDQLRGPDDNYEFVLANPPTHAGSAVLQQLFKDMVRVCRSTGYVVIVVRQQLNYEKWLKMIGVVTQMGVRDGYKVLQIRKKATVS